MRLFPKFSKKTAIKAGVIVVVIHVILLLGVHLWFENSDEWQEIQKLIISSPVVASYVGEIKQISLPILGLSFNFSGHRAEANLDVEVVGIDNTETLEVIAERKHWKWKIVSVSKN